MLRSRVRSRSSAWALGFILGFFGVLIFTYILSMFVTMLLIDVLLLMFAILLALFIIRDCLFTIMINVPVFVNSG